ncbi:MAG: outer membrane protein insertion porin family [Maribacter sp.]
MKNLLQISFFFILTLLLLVSSGCNTTKYLKKEEIILVEKNSVEIVSDKKIKIKNKGKLSDDLFNYYKQKPNGKFLGMFRTRLWFYHKNQSESDTTKWDNWVKRVVAEPPVVLKEKQTKGTAEAMKSYMQHKGYINAKVDYEIKIDSIKNLARNIYKVYPNKQYIFDTITFKSRDAFIQKVLNDVENESFLMKDSPVDVELYDKEVIRLVRLFRNLGYLDFTKNYISNLAVDTMGYKMNATLTVHSPQDSLGHQVYRVGKVYIYPNYNPDFREFYQEDKDEKGITYMSIGDPSIRYTTLDRNIKLRSGDLYQLNNEEITKKRLASLGIYKFISIKTAKREGERGIVDFKIFLPSKKRQELSADLEFNTANNRLTKTVSIGTAASLNYRNKNLFKGAEVLTTSLQGGVEFAISNPNELFNSVDVAASAELSIPKFVDYVGFYTLLNKMRILPNKNYRKLKETANTRIKLGYNYLNLLNFYDYNSLEASFGYNIIPKEQWRIQYTQTGIVYFNPSKPEPAFLEILDGNTFLKRSFSKQLFTGLLARDIQATYVGKPEKEDVSWGARMSGEISGMEVLTVNRIFSPKKEWRLFDTISYAQFLKFDLEQTTTKIISPKNSFAFKANVGVAFPFGRYADAVPYVKQFFIGGPNSVRAWSIRELGPGGYFDEVSSSSENTSPFYQTGDIKMEMSLEYRFDLFWLIEGAMFVDVGNVWTIKEDPSRPGSGFSKDFWKQFAVGTGFGVRMDFSFFVMRLDMGYPLRNNYNYLPVSEQSTNYWFYYPDPGFFRNINYNLAIGYPF